MMYIHSLWTYPVKSLSGISVEVAAALSTGIQYDREWVIADGNGRFISQRSHPQMTGISCSLSDTFLTLHRKGLEDLRIPLTGDSAETEAVEIWKDRVNAFRESKRASEWISEALDCRQLVLYRYDFRHRRGGPGGKQDTTTAFADARPYLICSMSSLDTLNARLQAKGIVPSVMEQFRPNIVFAGAEAFAEDRSAGMTLTESGRNFFFTEPCERCVIVTRDPGTGQSFGKGEPLRTLSEMDTIGGGSAYFGQNAGLSGEEAVILQVGAGITLF